MPTLPFNAAVVINALGSILTLSPLVSIKPPLPLIGAEAFKIPPTIVVPAFLPESNVIFPFSAVIFPVFSTSEATKLSEAPAFNCIVPPLADNTPLLFIVASAVFEFTLSFTALLSLNNRDTLFPAPKVILPCGAEILELFDTLLPIKAILPPGITEICP